jgi:c-di-GMP-binding flagellar brake protein YcgR
MKSTDTIDPRDSTKPIDPELGHRRSSLRLKTLKSEPVYLEVNLGGKINLLVTELGGGGAQVLCSKLREAFDDLDAGRSLGKSVLMLRAQTLVELEPVIRWKKWPVIGVQFNGLSDGDRGHIFRFLFELERKQTKRMNVEDNW